MNRHRLTADQTYDALLVLAGQLDPRRGGSPDGVDTRGDGLVTPKRRDSGWRRSIYLQQQRKVVVTHLETFDFPAMNPNCSERRDSTVATQALYLWNNPMIEELSRSLAERVYRQVGAAPEDQVDRLYPLVLGRPATVAERQAGVDALRAMTNAWQEYRLSEESRARDLEKGGTSDTNAAAPSTAAGSNYVTYSRLPDSDALLALATWCHAMMNSAEFLYVD